MSEESKNGIYDQSSFDAIKPRFNDKTKLSRDAFGKLKRRTGAAHSLRTAEVKDIELMKFKLWGEIKKLFKAEE